MQNPQRCYGLYTGEMFYSVKEPVKLEDGLVGVYAEALKNPKTNRHGRNTLHIYIEVVGEMLGVVLGPEGALLSLSTSSLLWKITALGK